MDLNFSTEKLSSTWNFINKLWNASRFVLMKLEDFKEEEYKFLGKIEKFETGKTYYTNTNNFKELTPLILNPYEELAFYLNPHYCYNPDTY